MLYDITFYEVNFCANSKNLGFPLFLPKSSATTNKMFGGVAALQNGKKKIIQIQKKLMKYFRFRLLTKMWKEPVITK